MNRHLLGSHGSPSRVAAVVAVIAWAVSTGVTGADPYDGTNPVNTVCGDAGSTIWTLGVKPHNAPGDEGHPTGIYHLGQKIGEVEIRHSRKCATVWARVRNLTGAAAQVKATIVIFSDSNGGGRTEHSTPAETVGNNNYSFSNQYRDRASFAAKGGVFYNGAWRYGETVRSVAWVQYVSNFPENPYACNHTANWPCERWPILASGLSVTRLYGLSVGLANMPTSTGGQRDVRGDVRFMFNQFNDVPASNPFFFEDTYAAADVRVFAYPECGVTARAWGRDSDGDHDYDWGEVKLSTCAAWDSSDATRGTLCHEIDHVMGLNHVWYSNPAMTISNIGSKATCLGMGSSTGPRIDDDSALDALYSGVIP